MPDDDLKSCTRTVELCSMTCFKAVSNFPQQLQKFRTANLYSQVPLIVLGCSWLISREEKACVTASDSRITFLCADKVTIYIIQEFSSRINGSSPRTDPLEITIELSIHINQRNRLADVLWYASLVTTSCVGCRHWDLSNTSAFFNQPDKCGSDSIRICGQSTGPLRPILVNLSSELEWVFAIAI